MGLKIDNLSGGYAGNNVLKNVTFEVPNGKIVALIGLNGAGKSTTINHVIGQRPPYAGSILLNDIDISQDPTAFKQQIAYIPEQPILYDELTLEEHLHFMLASHNIDDEQHWQRVLVLLAKFRLDNKLHWLPIHFSKGMRQKVMIVAAFMLNAPLLVVDEPFLGLDTLAQKDVVRLMEEQARQGNGVLLTTHLLGSAANYVDTFVVLKDGQVDFIGSPEALAQKHNLSLANLDDFFDLSQEGQNNGPN
ncbi:ABC transporter ATP-binding protein [Convivina praedatoris]|uniref:ABC-type transporter ATP-binding protein EcsA n=1 Tax=Convivina praedatoris TaxID=2880963 RepID=A0ABN8H6S8_9LACO|nr:ABC transporter ATP-binding protein [Convivina sp. LMG 32447]CAH1849922.1 ABC-type transporter ATP-binding protein EcsA [Convivina sp. LMG 32447]CAH1849926.1 ABC-type transporter ATP-binding protein EcsA [Convivina sp. LMG 32447]CAH1851322.1 ABC-type transporter ATP-binding protein EcsA [Convivina sp. LMG 32447]